MKGIGILAQATVWLPERASTVAPEVDWLFYFVLWASTVIFAGVVVAMLYFAWRYRRKDPEERPELVKENKLLEISWIVIPAILVLLVFTWGFRSYINLNVSPPDAYEITVRGRQWVWDFEYPNGAQVTGELHVPVNRPVRLRMSSEDVIHSFFVPAFRTKMDVLPNRYTTLWFEATDTGTYQIFCTEYCGTQHAGMLGEVVVHEEGEFQEWLQTAGGMEDLPPAEYGAILYEQQGCQQCHSLDGTPGVGPTLQGIYGTEEELADGSTVEVDENYLRESIIEPGAEIVAGYQNVMPPYSQLNESQVNALVEFIKEQ